MTAPKQGKLLLTTPERERLVDQNLKTEIRKRNNLIVKRKIQNWINQSEDVLFALENLTETQLENTVSDSEVFVLFKTTEKLLDKLNFVPVKGPVDNPYVAWHCPPTLSKMIMRRAKESDFERNWRVQEFVRYLKLCYPSDPEKEEPAYRTYRKRKEYKEIVAGIARLGLKSPDQSEEEYVNTP